MDFIVTPAIELILRIVVFYTFLAVLVSICIEIITRIICWRIIRLRIAISNLLTDKSGYDKGKELKKSFFGHPLLEGYLGWSKRRSLKLFNQVQIPKTTFSTIMMSLLSPTKDDIDEVKKEIKSWKDGDTKSTFESIANISKDGPTFRKNLETLYDDYGERTTILYERDTKILGAIIGLLILWIVNIDPLSYIQSSIFQSRIERIDNNLIEHRQSWHNDNLNEIFIFYMAYSEEQFDGRDKVFNYLNAHDSIIQKRELFISRLESTISMDIEMNEEISSVLIEDQIRRMRMFFSDIKVDLISAKTENIFSKFIKNLRDEIRGIETNERLPYLSSSDVTWYLDDPKPKDNEDYVIWIVKFLSAIAISFGSSTWFNFIKNLTDLKKIK